MERKPWRKLLTGGQHVIPHINSVQRYLFLHRPSTAWSLNHIPLDPGAVSSTGNAAEGAASKEMNAAIALYLIVWGFILLTFFIFSIRINAVLSVIFLLVTVGAWVLSGAISRLVVLAFSSVVCLVGTCLL